MNRVNAHIHIWFAFKVSVFPVTVYVSVLNVIQQTYRSKVDIRCNAKALGMCVVADYQYIHLRTGN